MAPRPVIALEEHLLPKDVAAAIGVDPASLVGKSDALDDLGEGRLQSMDAAGIDVQVLSAVALVSPASRRGSAAR